MINIILLYLILKISKYNNIILKNKERFNSIKNIGLLDINEDVTGLPINILFKGNFRENQIEIIDKIIPYINKTVLELYLAYHYKVKTLIIVHKTFLLNQWKKRA